MKGKQRHRGWWKASCRGQQSQARKVLAGWAGCLVVEARRAWWSRGCLAFGVQAGGRRKRRAGNREGGSLLGCGVGKCFAMADAILTRCWLV